MAFSRILITLAGLSFALLASAFTPQQTQEVIPTNTELPQLSPPRQAPSQDAQASGSVRANAIAAVVEDRIITIDEVRREIALLVPQLQRDSRSEQEFQQRLRLLEDEVVQNLVDRVLIVKHFEKQGFSVPRSYVENELEELVRTDFDGD